ncbi:DUF2285 domain-containing protein [Mesorhizobium sp. M1076]|uniref:hypothetical protein n=1 Tax=Mesorhizobium sp. M1076 TaxID=2957054 RepID=UPI003337EC98
MKYPDVEPGLKDEVPWSDSLTAYDKEHFTTYLRFLDASADNASYEEMAQVILGIDPVLQGIVRRMRENGRQYPALVSSRRDHTVRHKSGMAAGAAGNSVQIGRSRLARPPDRASFG